MSQRKKVAKKNNKVVVHKFSPAPAKTDYVLLGLRVLTGTFMATILGLAAASMALGVRKQYREEFKDRNRK